MVDHLGTPILLWVCIDCMLTHANGECGEDTDREPLVEIPEGAELTAGLLAEEHADDCEVRSTGSYPVNYECECDRRTFSQQDCDGCGSTLHGERHALTMWVREGK